MTKKTVHCCEFMDMFLQDQKMPLKYYPIAREYGITLKHSSAVQLLVYCPWCGVKLPESLRDKYFDILKVEYDIEPELDIQDDPNIPEEFKSDSWWKMRGL